MKSIERAAASKMGLTGGAYWWLRALIFGASLVSPLGVSVAGTPVPDQVRNKAPDTQIAFIRILRETRIGYYDIYMKGNEAKREVLLADRATKLCEVLADQSIDGWSGYLYRIMEDKGLLVVMFEVAPHVILKVDSNPSFFREFPDTRLPADAVLAMRLRQLEDGSSVRIFGKFARYPHSGSCIIETSWTHSGAFEEPHFLIELQDIRPLN